MYWFHESRIDLHGHGPVKQGDGQDKPVASLELYKYSFMSSQRACIYSNSVARTEKRPWLVRKTGGYQSLKRKNLRFLDGHGRAVVPGYLNDTWRLKNWQALLRVEPAKEIARKQGGLHTLDSIRPALSAGMQWKE
jgi:hypothetical protein